MAVGGGWADVMLLVMEKTLKRVERGREGRGPTATGKIEHQRLPV